MPAGRPKIYDTPEELQDAVDLYFEETSPTEVTITGLALFLGFADRQSLYDYEKNDQFSCIIKRARLRVENRYELRLNTQFSTGAIFALKNMGWNDKQTIQHEGNAEAPVIFQLDPRFGKEGN